MSLTTTQQAAYDPITGQAQQATALTAGTTTPITFTPGLANMSAIDKALEYNKLISSGATDPQIRAAADSAFDTQSAEDWQYLTGLAAQMRPAATPAATFTAGLPNFGALNNVATTSQNAGLQDNLALNNTAVSNTGSLAATTPTTIYDPTNFYNLLQANDATASQATTTGLNLLSQAGYTPEQGVDLWNAAYGTEFTANDYTRALINHGIVQAANPQLAVFGDSISSVVGYNDDSSADTSSGLNLAQYLGQDLKLTAANNSIGGQTSSDALNGTSIPFSGTEIPISYGTYGSYLSTNNPEIAVLRFGAADAIRLNDPALSISNIEKMVQMAQQNGTKPILVGVTPFAKQGDFNAGNITSGVTDAMIQSADAINEGIKNLADKYGVQFVDVRKVEVPEGGLLDGVHPTGAYGASLDRYIADQIKSGAKAPTSATAASAFAGADSNALVGLKSSFGDQGGQEGILSGFKYAKDQGLDESTMRQVLGEDVFNTYKTGFADYAKTGIANILADGQLSFDEARETVKFGRDYGYDAQTLADLTGTDKKVFDAIYKNYDDTTDRIVGGVLGAEDVKTDADRVARAYLLQNKFGFTDEDLARATNYDAKKLKADLEPVRNFTSNYESLTKSTDSTLQDRKKFLEDARSNGAISQLYGEGLNNLDAQITELENKWNSYGDVDPYHAERIFRELAPQREALGDKYYQGRFSDPMKIAATLASKGIDTAADIGQKDKFQPTTAEARYTLNGVPVMSADGKNFYRSVEVGDSMGYEPVDAKDVQTTYGKYATTGDSEVGYETTFQPLAEEELATLKDGTYQKKVGTVAIDKDTGKEIAGIDGTIASEKSGKWYNKKDNDLNVGFNKDGTPILYTTEEKRGFGAALQQALPVISFALPFMLPGLGAGLSGLLPGAGVAASGAAAAIAPTLMNQALTQGILSGGLSTLGGGKFEKGFLGGAVSPLISTGISNLLPAGMDKNAARAITGAGTGVVKGAMQGGNFEDLLQAGILSGATNYGLNTALQGLNLTPQQLNFATGIALPLIQGEKVNPLKVVGTLANYQSSQPR